MRKIFFVFATVLTALSMAGCTRHELVAVNGQSSILSMDWKSKIQTGQTTEQELVALLGRPTAYYHRMPNVNEMYVFYSSLATVMTINHYPFFPKAQFYCKQTPHASREWFLVSKGQIIKHISSRSLENDPDLNSFVRASGPEYPYCEKTKCKLKKQDPKAGISGNHINVNFRTF